MPAIAPAAPSIAASPAAAKPSPPPAPAGSRPQSMNLPAPSSGGSGGKGVFKNDDPFNAPSATPASPTPAPKPAPATPAPPAAAPTTPPASQEVPKPGEAAKPAPEAKTEPAVGTPKWARTEIDKANGLRKAAEDKARELEEKLSKVQPVDADALTKTIASKDEEISKLREKLGQHEFTQSDDFKGKYVQPFNDRYEFASTNVKRMLVNNADGTQRNATEDDLRGVYHTAKSNLTAAFEQAQQLFGNGSNWVMGEVNAMLNLEYQHDRALTGERSNWEKTNAERTAKSQAEDAAFKSMAGKIITDMVNKNPELYGEANGDTEGNNILTKGFQMVDGFFTNYAALKPEQRATLLANIRLKAGAFDRQQHVLGQLRQELAEKDGVIAELRGSTPGAQPSNHPTNAPAEAKGESMMQELDRISRGG